MLAQAKATVKLDKMANVAYVCLQPDLDGQPGVVIESLKVDGREIVLDFDAFGNLFGVELLDANRYLR